MDVQTAAQDRGMTVGASSPQGSKPIDPTASLGQLVTEHPGAARVLERHGLDYCCGGRSSLQQAAAQAGTDLDAVLDELASLTPGAAPDWASMSPTELVDHIESQHHAYLRSELLRLGQLVDKVATVHGERHPELAEVRATFEALRADLLPHLVKEERVLFPAVRELDTATTMPWFPFGTTAGPVTVMMSEHDTVGDLLERMRALTDGYQAPADGCASFRALYEGLEELEADTHLHVHKENNVLFPAVSRMEQALARA